MGIVQRDLWEVPPDPSLGGLMSALTTTRDHWTLHGATL